MPVEWHGFQPNAKAECASAAPALGMAAMAWWFEQRNVPVQWHRSRPNAGELRAFLMARIWFVNTKINIFLVCQRLTPLVNQDDAASGITRHRTLLSYGRTTGQESPRT